MQQFHLRPHLSDEELIAALNGSRNTPEFRRWQILYLIQIGQLLSAELIAPVVGLSKPSIHKIVQAYNKNGTSAITVRPRGGRRRSLMSIEEEQRLFERIEDQAQKGLIKTANDIRAMVEAQVRKTVSDDFLWDLLHRNGWKKKMPRPHHPKSNKAEQASFKKNSPKIWSP